MAHIHEKIDFCVDVFIVYKNKVLLRMHEKYKAWLAVGGHIELDEDPNQAALREVLEEVGLTVTLVGNIPELKGKEGYKELIPPYFMNIHPISDTHRHISMVYFAKADTDTVMPENETDEWKWVTHEELADMDIKDTIRYYAQCALNELAEK